MSGRAAGAGRAARNGVGECAQRPLVGSQAVSPRSRRYVCDVSRANQSVPGIRAARSRVARIVLRTCVPRGAMHSDVHLTLSRSRGAKQASLRVRHLKLSQYVALFVLTCFIRVRFNKVWFYSNKRE